MWRIRGLPQASERRQGGKFWHWYKWFNRNVDCIYSLPNGPKLQYVCVYVNIPNGGSVPVSILRSHFLPVSLMETLDGSVAICMMMKWTWSRKKGLPGCCRAVIPLPHHTRHQKMQLCRTQMKRYDFCISLSHLCFIISFPWLKFRIFNHQAAPDDKPSETQRHR